MKKLVIAVALPSLLFSSFSADLNTNDDKITYTIGNQIGSSLQAANESIKLDQKILFEAISDSLKKNKSQLDKKAMSAAMTELQAKMEKVIQEKNKKQIVANKAESEKFLSQNKIKKGVKTTASGLQYRVVKSGAGEKPKATDTVKVKYKGSLVNGKEFDSSENAPSGTVEIPLNGVIPGWIEGLQLMPVGSTYEFFIPAKLAYGDTAPPSIGPSRVLIFEVELVGINVEKK